MVRLVFILITLSTIAFGQSSIKKTPITFNFITDASFKQKTFKFYISSIKLNLKNGHVHEEKNQCYLIDQELLKSQIIYLDNSDEIESIQFLIGTDSLVNVSGILDGDLDPVKGMYWAWNSGYINFKLEGDFTKGGNTYPIELHIGGYNGIQATAQRMIIPLKSKLNDSLTINVEPTLLLNKLNINTQNSIMIPGVKAVEISKLLPTIFSISD